MRPVLRAGVVVSCLGVVPSLACYRAEICEAPGVACEDPREDDDDGDGDEDPAQEARVPDLAAAPRPSAPSVRSAQTR